MPFVPGGLTISPAVVSYFAGTGAFTRTMPFGCIFKGDDNVLYYLGGTNAGSTEIQVRKVSDGTQAFSRTVAQVLSDANGIGLTPPGGGIGVGGGSFSAFAIPETSYFVVILGTASGPNADKRVVYYRINSGGALVVVGGYAGKTDGLAVQFSPRGTSAGSAIGGFCGGGFITSVTTPGTNSTVPYKHPIAVAYAGEGRATLLVIPSINKILSATTILENATTPWINKEDNIESTAFGNNIFDIDAIASNGEFVNGRGFFMPTAAGATFGMAFYRQDLNEHVGGTASPSNAFLTTNAPLYPTGLVSSIGLNVTTNLSLPFEFDAALGSIVTARHTDILTSAGALNYPFPDDTQNFDNSAGLATENYYCQPALYPSDTNDYTQPWFVFFPRVYRKSGERGRVGVRIFQYFPTSGTMTELAYAKTTLWTPGSGGIPAQFWNNSAEVAIHWERSTNTLYAVGYTLDFSGYGFAIGTLGTFVPVFTGNNGGDTIGNSEDFRLRAWGFTLDGHSFYVLRLGRLGTWVYDKRTDQFCRWQTGIYDIWDSGNGTNWNKRVVTGAYADPHIYELDMTSALDNVGVVVGGIPITRTVTGLVSVRRRDTVSCDGVYVAASVGFPVSGSATMTLSYSDDYGNTFTVPRSVALGGSDTRKEIAFRSLGLMRAPGRVFSIVDSGAVVRIDGADLIADGDV